jgi:hypothetical protein
LKLHSHKEGKGLLTVKQQHAIRTAVKSAPLQSGSAVHANLKNFSPGRHVATNRRSMEAVSRLVRQERKALMAARVPGQKIDGSEGAMTKLAKSFSLKTAIERHNDPDDSITWRLIRWYVSVTNSRTACASWCSRRRI